MSTTSRGEDGPRMYHVYWLKLTPKVHKKCTSQLSPRIGAEAILFQESQLPSQHEAFHYQSTSMPINIPRNRTTLKLLCNHPLRMWDSHLKACVLSSKPQIAPSHASNFFASHREQMSIGCTESLVTDAGATLWRGAIAGPSFSESYR